MTNYSDAIAIALDAHKMGRQAEALAIASEQGLSATEAVEVFANMLAHEAWVEAGEPIGATLDGKPSRTIRKTKRPAYRPAWA